MEYVYVKNSEDYVFKKLGSELSPIPVRLFFLTLSLGSL